MVTTTTSRERGLEGLSFTETLLGRDPNKYDSNWSEAVNGKRNVLLSKLPISFEFTDPDLQAVLEKYRARMVELGIFDNPYSSEDQRFRQRGLIGTVLLIGFDTRTVSKAVSLKADIIRFFGNLGALDRKYNGNMLENDPVIEVLRRGAQLRRAVPVLKALSVLGGEKAVRKTLAILGA